MKELENKLNEALVKNAPFQLPEKARQWIADYAWVFALIGLVFGLLAVLPLLAVLGFASTLTTALGVQHTLALAWVSFFALLAYLVVLGISVPKLKAKQALGWDLMYYSTLAYFVYDVVYALSYFGASAVFNLIWSIVGLVVSLYVLFQVRDKFKGSKATPRAAVKKN